MKLYWCAEAAEVEMDFKTRWKKIEIEIKRNINNRSLTRSFFLFFPCLIHLQNEVSCHKAAKHVAVAEVIFSRFDILSSATRCKRQKKRKTQRNSKPVIESVYTRQLNVSEDFSNRSDDFLFAVQSRLQESFSTKNERDEIRLIDETGKKYDFWALFGKKIKFVTWKIAINKYCSSERR